LTRALRASGLDPNPENVTVDERRVAMDATPAKRDCMRLAAIHMLLMGVARQTVCKAFFRSDRVVRLFWIE